MYTEFLEELLPHFPDAWLADAWEMVGIGNSKLWLRVDETYRDVPKQPKSWDNVRVEVRLGGGPDGRRLVKSWHGPFENAEEAALSVRAFVESYA
jgi:hypothetical protein